MRGLSDLTWTSRVLEAKKDLLLSAGMSLTTSLGSPALAAVLAAFLIGVLQATLFNQLRFLFLTISVVAGFLNPWVYSFNRKKVLKYIFTKKPRLIATI